MSAVWCQRIAVFLLPYFVFAILLHRFEKILTPQLFVILAIGLVMAVLSLILAIKGAADLWNKGHRGGTNLVRGLSLAAIVLLPFGFYAFLALALPLANDVSTNTFDPPNFLRAQQQRASEVASGINQLADYDDIYSESIVNAYPKVGPRRYPAGAERVLQAVQLIIKDNDWKISATQGVPESEKDDGDEVKLEDNVKVEEKQTDSAADGAEVPDAISVEVVITSFIFGYKSDAIINIVSEDVNTLVEMRSSSRWGAHDFGSNASTIESFLSQLDLALLGIAGEG